MTVESNDILRVYYTMNGVAELPFQFPVAQTRDVVVYSKDTTSGESNPLEQGVDYTVTLTTPDDLPSEGSITLLDSELYNNTDIEVLITRMTEQKQPYDMKYNQEMNPEQLELEEDRTVMMIQDLRQVVDEDVLRIKVTEREINTQIQVPEEGSPCDLLVMCPQGIGQIPATPEQPFINLVEVSGKLNPVHVISPDGTPYSIPVIAGNYYFLDDSNGEVTLTFPPTLSVKDEFGIATLSETHGKCYVDPNGIKFFGQYDIVRWNLANSGLFLQYVSEEIGVLNQSALEGISEEPSSGGGGGEISGVSPYKGMFTIQQVAGTDSTIQIVDPTNTHNKAGLFIIDGKGFYDIPESSAHLVSNQVEYVTLQFNLPSDGSTSVTDFRYLFTTDEYKLEDENYKYCYEIGRVYYLDTEQKIESITQSQTGCIRYKENQQYFGEFAIVQSNDGSTDVNVINNITMDATYCGKVNLSGSALFDVECEYGIQVPADNNWYFIILSTILHNDAGEIIEEFNFTITLENSEKQDTNLETYITIGAVKSDGFNVDIQQYSRGLIKANVYTY